MLFHASTLVSFAALASAWDPHHRNMTAPDGNNLFEAKHNEMPATKGNSKRWLPGTVPIRGVNFGSLFVVEPWMCSTEWANVLQCGSTSSEFDCVKSLGQSTANTNFQKHWGSWITQSDIQLMASYSLNTIRIPVGYWIIESLKYDSEFFPEGGLAFLSQVCGWASDQGFYIIIDLHGAPFAQVSQNADSGQLAGAITNSNPAFYQQSQFDRATSFLSQMTTYIHQNGGTTGPMRNVGMLEVLNEPETNIPSELLQAMRQTYYPAALQAIRDAESVLGITQNNALHVEFMNALWNAGDPKQYLPDLTNTAFDDHRYLKWDSSVTATQAGYMAASCADNRGGDSPTIVGEWSLSVADSVENSDSQFYPVSNNIDFYQKWFAAQVQAYEKQEGWIFWAWKAQLGDVRWSYTDAVTAGIIPKDLSTVPGMSVC